jgi:hypothetical protein
VVEEALSLTRKLAQFFPSRRGASDVNLSILVEKMFDVMDQSSILVKLWGLSTEDINTM